ncbi:MAG: hypothetical protein ABSF28_07315 [Terracidiphilus sp.]|jgi:hypothetical protein
MANRLIVAIALMALAAAGSRVWGQTLASNASKAAHPATPAPTAPGPVQSPSKTEVPKFGGSGVSAPVVHLPPRPIRDPGPRELKPLKEGEVSPKTLAARREREQELEQVLPLLQRMPVGTWVDPAPIKQGQPLTRRELDAFSDVLGTFVFTPAAGYVPPRGTCTLTTTFFPLDSKRYYTTSSTVVLEVE